MTRLEAHNQAKAVHSRLHDFIRDQWRIVVQENVGWRWYLESCNGLFTLAGGDKGELEFSCMLSANRFNNCGYPDWTDNQTFDDPNMAIIHAMNVAAGLIDQLQKRVDLAKKACPVAITFNLEKKQAGGRYSIEASNQSLEVASEALQELRKSGLDGYRIRPVFDKLPEALARLAKK